MPKDRQKFGQIIPIGIFITNDKKNRPGTYPGLLTQTIEKLTYVFNIVDRKQRGSSLCRDNLIGQRQLNQLRRIFGLTFPQQVLSVSLYGVVTDVQFARNLFSS
jgi:hypothetical protein